MNKRSWILKFIKTHFQDHVAHLRHGRNEKSRVAQHLSENNNSVVDKPLKWGKTNTS